MADIAIAMGANITLLAQVLEDIRVSAGAVASVFRGEQIESSSINLPHKANVVLTGVSFGGTVSEVDVPCLTFAASMVVGRVFVKGQTSEITEISLDSSIQIGVQLYSCTNKLMNPTSFSSAYFTLDDLRIDANIDPVRSLIYCIAKPEDLSVLTRDKVYSLKSHVIDKSGNLSTVLIRNLRFT